MQVQYTCRDKLPEGQSYFCPLGKWATLHTVLTTVWVKGQGDFYRISSSSSSL